MAVWAAIVLSVVEVIVACTILLGFRHVVGYAFSDVKEFVDYLDDITPLVCLLLTMDCIQAVLSGLFHLHFFSLLFFLSIGQSPLCLSNQYIRKTLVLSSPL